MTDNSLYSSSGNVQGVQGVQGKIKLILHGVLHTDVQGVQGNVQGEKITLNTIKCF